MNGVTFLITLYGHDIIHKMQKYLSWLFFIVFMIATYMVFQLPLPAGSWSPGSLNLSAFMLSVAVVATWQLSFAPYVADYSHERAKGDHAWQRAADRMRRGQVPQYL